MPSPISSSIQFFKCLADETRLRILLLTLSEGELCVCEFMAALNDSQPKISRHLAQLRHGGILTDERRGAWVYYSLNEELPDWVKDVLAVLRRTHTEPLNALIHQLKCMQNRPNGC